MVRRPPSLQPSVCNQSITGSCKLLMQARHSKLLSHLAVLTDNFWYSDGWPSAIAPRCLPCHFNVTTLTNTSAFPANIGCPCTPELACTTVRDAAMDPPYPSIGHRYMNPKDCQDRHIFVNATMCPLDVSCFLFNSTHYAEKCDPVITCVTM